MLLAACSAPPALPPGPRPSAEPPALEVASPAPQASAAPASAPPAGPCPEDMVDVAVACIDRYEAPNLAGAMPLVMRSLDDARAFCSERGKRLCTEDEWLRACRGPEGLPFPYGKRYDEHACNHDKAYRAPSWSKLGKWPAEVAKAEVARLDQAEPSGARPRCVSAEGVYDLTGNVAEWVVKSHGHPEACQTPEQRQHQHVVQGCSWVKCYRPPHEPACGYVNCAHPDGFHSYEMGVRCCKDRRR